MGPRIPCRAGLLQHPIHLQLQLGLRRHITAVMHGLRAIGAVLFTATGFDAQQGRQLHVITGWMRIAMHLLSAPKQIHQRQLQQGFDFSEIPVVANESGHQISSCTPPKRR